MTISEDCTGRVALIWKTMDFHSLYVVISSKQKIFVISHRIFLFSIISYNLRKFRLGPHSCIYRVLLSLFHWHSNVHMQLEM
jgi:hypothetical protein